MTSSLLPQSRPARCGRKYFPSLKTCAPFGAPQTPPPQPLRSSAFSFLLRCIPLFFAATSFFPTIGHPDLRIPLQPEISPVPPPHALDFPARPFSFFSFSQANVESTRSRGLRVSFAVFSLGGSARPSRTQLPFSFSLNQSHKDFLTCHDFPSFRLGLVPASPPDLDTPGSPPASSLEGGGADLESKVLPSASPLGPWGQTALPPLLHPLFYLLPPPWDKEDWAVVFARNRRSASIFFFYQGVQGLLFFFFPTAQGLFPCGPMIVFLEDGNPPSSSLSSGMASSLYQSLSSEKGPSPLLPPPACWVATRCQPTNVPPSRPIPNPFFCQRVPLRT